MIRHTQWLIVLLWGAASWISHLPATAGQELLVANNTANSHESILRFSATGECRGNFALTSHRAGPVGMAFDTHGILYVANHGNNTIHRYSSSGTDLGIFTSTGLNLPTGLAFNRAGQLVVCNYGDGSLNTYSATGELLSQISTSLLGPIALVLDSHDNIFVSTPNIGANSGVFRFSAAGNQSTLFATGIDFDPRGLAFDEAGNLYVANQHGNTVRRYNPEGVFLDTFASTGLKDPFALAFDDWGDLYIANQSGGTIRRYSACGEDLGTFATIPTAFANPVGLAFIPVPEPNASLLLISAAVVGFWGRRQFANL